MDLGSRKGKCLSGWNILRRKRFRQLACRLSNMGAWDSRTGPREATSDSQVFFYLLFFLA
ncbi:hypothetical protein SETIT_3G035600v2 [Setaria italica]|uniref:Uncharacterized protein n=1 Tax=Setaria italica TaxID=4555 RepID=A0A368QB48_SETIT|nr:hypothetical protein SETIT_3G035600v2 [Setaria italica]